MPQPGAVCGRESLPGQQIVEVEVEEKSRRIFGMEFRFGETLRQKVALEDPGGARPELLRTRESSPEETERFFEQFRHAGKRPDAVCCLNDVCAGDLIRDAHRRGIRLDGIRLSGFDHASLTAFLPHELLTVKPPFEELGKCAAELLIRQIENPGFGFIRKKLESRLISIQPTDFSQEETTHFPAAK